MPIIVSDASPLHYLVLIGEVDLLPALYGSVLLPEAVADELRRPQTPAAVRDWLSLSPTWLEIVPPGARGRAETTGGISLPALAYLGQGEREAIILALDRNADLLLIDDLGGRGRSSPPRTNGHRHIGRFGTSRGARTDRLARRSRSLASHKLPRGPSRDSGSAGARRLQTKIGRHPDLLSFRENDRGLRYPALAGDTDSAVRVLSDRYGISLRIWARWWYKRTEGNKRKEVGAGTKDDAQSREAHQGLSLGRRGGGSLRGSRLRNRQGRVGGIDWRVGFGKDDLAPPACGSGHSDARRGILRRWAIERVWGGRASRLSQHAARVRLADVLPAAGVYSARERDASPAHSRTRFGGGPGEGPATAGGSGIGARVVAPGGGTFRRRAAAGGTGAGVGESAGDPAGRRADRKSGSPHGGARDGNAGRVASDPRADFGAGDAQPGTGSPRRSNPSPGERQADRRE